MEGRHRVDVLVIGAGPTGLGAAWRLSELDASEGLRWLVVDAAFSPGGMARSVRDDTGFVWDFGGHIIYSHYPYFDEVMAKLHLEWAHHVRSRWIWMDRRLIPYPLQHNIHRLRPELVSACLNEFSQKAEAAASAPSNFREWLLFNFGETLCDEFFFPLNLKMWAHPADELSCDWVMQRSGSGYANVPVVDWTRLIQSIEQGLDNPGWDENTTFPYPVDGGTGEIWRRIAESLPPDSLRLGIAVCGIDVRRHVAEFADGSTVQYEKLLSTMPLPTLLTMPGGDTDAQCLASNFKATRAHVIGLGFRGHAPAVLDGKYWIYFPEVAIPFHRVFLLSNYGSGNVPSGEPHWSVLCEISESPVRPMDAESLVRRCIQSFAECVDSDLAPVSVWQSELPFGYPVPCVGRDEVLERAQGGLRRRDIWSRGRFGGWKYEVSNQDHGFMQGVEAVDNMLTGVPEVTYFGPEPARVV